MTGSTQWVPTDDHDPIDQILADFESYWRSGRRPRIEVHLEKGGPADPARLFEALLVSELLHRERLGETPDVDEYRQRFPGLAASIAPCFERARFEASGRSWNLGTETGAEASYGTADHGPDDASNGSTNDPNTHGCRYEKLREHAQGNLGKVFIARDAELNREVALKEIQSRHADRVDSRLRFILEGEVTGRLDHPGIVPVHGLGHYPDGRPFYAMRFVRGETLKDAIRQSRNGAETGSKGPPASLRSLVSRLVDAGQAIAYAHSRGILHRDIKPENILLGPFGETLVVDWGLALPIARSEGDERSAEGTLEPSSEAGSAHDRTGSVLGTPGYMSPEQAAGEIEDLTPRSDVYCLGATLYCVLTGRAPFLGGDVRSILKGVRTGDFARPRSLRPDIPRPLESICLKALALRPIDRYSGAREFTEDLQRWLDDEPILACREPITARLARWTRTHQPVVAGVSAIGLTALVGLAVHDRSVARDRLRTEDNFARSRATVHFMLDELAADQLAYIPGSEMVRKKLAIRSLDDLELFLKERPNHVSLRSEVAEAHRELGNIERWIGYYGSPRNHYQAALALVKSLSEEFPEQHDLRRRQAAIIIEIGELLRIEGLYLKAEDQYRQAIEMIEAELVKHPDDVNLRRTRAVALLDRCYSQLERGDDSATWNSAERAIAEFSSLGSTNTTVSDQRFAIGGLIGLGEAFRHLKDWARGRTALDDAIDRARKLVEGNSKDANSRYFLALALKERGRLLAAQENLTGDAIRDYREALALFQRLSTTSTEVPVYQVALARTHDALGAALAEIGQLMEAKSECEQASSLLGKLNAVRKLSIYLSYQGENLGNLATIARKAGENQKAISLFEKAIETQRKAADRRPDCKVDAQLIRRHQTDMELARIGARP